MPDNNDQEQDLYPDEQETVISDLPEDEQERDRGRKRRNRPDPGSRKISLIARYTPRQRKRQAIITGSAILVALIVFVVCAFPVQALFGQFISSQQVASGDTLF